MQYHTRYLQYGRHLDIQTAAKSALIMENTSSMQLELHDTVNTSYFTPNDRMFIIKKMMNVGRAMAYHGFQTMLET